MAEKKTKKVRKYADYVKVVKHIITSPFKSKKKKKPNTGETYKKLYGKSRPTKY